MQAIIKFWLTIWRLTKETAIKKNDFNNGHSSLLLNFKFYLLFHVLYVHLFKDFMSWFFNLFIFVFASSSSVQVQFLHPLILHQVGIFFRKRASRK